MLDIKKNRLYLPDPVIKNFLKTCPEGNGRLPPGLVGDFPVVTDEDRIIHRPEKVLVGPDGYGDPCYPERRDTISAMLYPFPLQTL